MESFDAYNSAKISEPYDKGNPELLTMFESKVFDYAVARDIIADIPDLNKPILNLYGYSTTYLSEAEEYNNIEAVRFLLKMAQIQIWMFRI